MDEILGTPRIAVVVLASGRYILLVDGRFAFPKGRDGEQYITATRRGGRWWITPNTSAHPRCGTSPGD
jgi:hypothetical protein